MTELPEDFRMLPDEDAKVGMVFLLFNFRNGPRWLTGKWRTNELSDDGYWYTEDGSYQENQAIGWLPVVYPPVPKP